MAFEPTSSLPRAVAFDCYGTLLRIGDQRQPYSRLATLAGGRLDPSPLTTPLSLAEILVRNSVPIEISNSELKSLEADLKAEVASVCADKNALDVLMRLRGCGFRIGLISNLAAPYAEPVQRVLGNFVDTQVFSFEVGAAKPSRRIYDELCGCLGVQPQDVLMVGDSMSNDFHGALAAGLNARHLASGVSLKALLKDLL